jgi:hypothetical protein
MLEAPPQPMKISLFKGTRENQMALVDSVPEVTWDTLPGLVTSAPWAPALYKNGHRLNANLETMSLFVCDIDEGMTIEEARKAFAPYRCIIGTSKSHQREKVKRSGATVPPCDRFRVILELAEPITSDRDFKATWFAVQKICPTMDPSCKDAGRFYWPCVEIVGQWDGALLPVTRYEAPTTKRGTVERGGKRLDLSKRTYRFKAEGAPEGQWHAELVAACMDMKQQLWGEDEATEWLEGVTGHLDEHDLGVIEDVWANRTPRHPAREENTDEAARALIRRCTLLKNLADKDEYVFLDREKGETYRIDIVEAAATLGKDDWREYGRTSRKKAFFTYNPYVRPLVPNSEGVLVYNTYRPAPWRHREYWFGEPIPALAELPEPFAEFFTHLTDGHEQSKEYLLDWMAYSLKARNFTILTAIGSQGVGKGILAEIFKHLHGEHNYCQPKDDVFKERFNSPLKDKTLVNVDEIALKTKEDHDRLKAVVNDWIAIEEKGRDATNRRNFANFYISSNHLDAIQIEPGDRRYSIIQLASKKIIETGLRNRINDLTSAPMVAELGRYLLHRKVTNDMLVPFRSPRFEEVRQAGLTDWELYMVEEFCPVHAGRTYPVSFVLDTIKEAAELKSLGRRRLSELQKKYPEKFHVVCDPKNPAKRVVRIF